MKEFFTIPDNDLTQESSVDPMGIQVIWTYYGQSIFGEKLTTIANDLRVFTFNLFHHHLINKLFLDNTEEIQQAKYKYMSWQSEADVKTGLLMFLEDLVTHIFYLKQNSTDIEIEKLGILGLSKARIAHNTSTLDKIYLSAYKKQGLLKNQINLGMTGRYKGPMMIMQFFDRSFTYTPKTWESVDRFFYNWKDAVDLENNIIKLITDVVFKAPKKDFPQISLQDLKNNKLWKSISDGYLICFGRRKLPTDIKKYWQDRLGISSGAPKALYDEITKLNEKEYINHHQIFVNAREQLKSELQELIKIDYVINIEPFLSHAEFLLRFISQPGVKNIKDNKVDLEILRDEIVKSSHFIIDSKQTRLKELHSIMIMNGTVEDWIKRILEYHKKVMEQRSNTAWLELDAENNIRHYFTPVLPEYRNTIPKYLETKPWFHTYYLETLRSIHNGLN